MSLPYVHLHAHSTFSFLDGYGTPKEIAGRIRELGHNAVALTDHGTIFGHAPHQTACRKAGIKPIFGVEAYLVDSIAEKTRHQASIGADGLPHLTLLAATQTGYSNLLQLIKISNSEGFYHKPRIDFDLLARHQEGLVVLSGCPGGYPTQLLINRGMEAAYMHCLRMKQIVQNYFVEIVPEPGLYDFDGTYDNLVRIAAALQLPIVLTADAHFPRAADYEAQDMMLAVGLKRRVDDTSRLQLPSYQYYCSVDELYARAKAVMPGTSDHDIIQGLANTQTIADFCNVEIPKAHPVVFPKADPKVGSETFLWNKLVDKFGEMRQKGYISDADRDVYFERMRREFDTIKRKNFCDYILVVEDLISYIRSIGGLVVCRGSAGGCLMLWVLGCSVTDPIRHDLSFERFYDDNRPDPPDVDIDFEKGFRNQAIEYIFRLYGHENCALIATLSQIKAKAALQDAAMAMGIPRSEYEPLSKVLDSKDEDVETQLSSVSDPAALAVLEKYPRLRIIDKLVGQYRQSSIHAAGVLISSKSLAENIGLFLSRDNTQIATVDKYGAADLEYLKLDALTVTALDRIALAARKIWGSIEPLYDLARDLNNPYCWKAANDGKLAGVFQLEGASAHRAVREIGISSFEDLYAASALCRPGPSEYIPIYRRNKESLANFQNMLAGMHPVAASIVEPTFGVILYQEQVMKLARELAGFEWANVHKLRKGITSSSGDALQQWKNLFVEGCKNHSGLSEAEALTWWHMVETHGFYSFNKAHCVTYGIVGYWTLYLKTYHAAEYYEAQLVSEEGNIVRKRLLKEYQREGGTVLLIHPELSRARTRAANGMIVGGFGDLFGVGEIQANKLERMAPFESYDALLAVLPAKTRDLLLAAYDGEWHPEKVIEVAPWFPLPVHGVRKYGVSPGMLPDREVEGTVTIEGWVIETDFKKDNTTVWVEDAGGFAVAKVSAKRATRLGPIVRQFKIGDYVALDGWWSGDALYISAAVKM